MCKRLSYWLTVSAFCASCAFGQFESGSDGSDGPFNPQADIEIELGLAATGPWDMESPVEGQGVYDPEQWAVVFKYTTIDIPAEVTVTFKNHPKGAPVVWLAQGDVTIDGKVNLDGKLGSPRYAQPGPGGFEGGIGKDALPASGGLGPGGGGTGGGGGFGSPGDGTNGGETYGNPPVVPLIGGSGGGGRVNTPTSGGSGAGSILIASSGTIAFGSIGRIYAEGGDGRGSSSGAGSGGGIRLIANEISSSGGDLFARGGVEDFNGGDGRIRLEATDIFFNGTILPAPSISFSPGPVFAEDVPTLAVESIDVPMQGTIPFPSDPDAGILTTDVDPLDDATNATLNIVSTNILEGTIVRVRIVPAHGNLVEFDSDPIALDGTTTALVTLPPGRSEIQLRANWTP